jgi:hypothetical protein
MLSRAAADESIDDSDKENPGEVSRQLFQDHAWSHPRRLRCMLVIMIFDVLTVSGLWLGMWFTGNFDIENTAMTLSESYQQIS